MVNQMVQFQFEKYQENKNKDFFMQNINFVIKGHCFLLKRSSSFIHLDLIPGPHIKSTKPLLESKKGY